MPVIRSAFATTTPFFSKLTLRSGFALFAVSLAITGISTVTSVHAQDVSATDVPDAALIQRLQAEYAGDEMPVCLVSAAGEEGAPQMVLAGCNGQGIMLGAADSYETVTHAESGVTLVVMHLAGETSVQMLSLDAEGIPLRENLTSTLARAAGRGAMANLRDIRVDLARFRATGEIQLVPDIRDGARPANAASYNVQALRDAERARADALPRAASEGGEN